MTRTGKRPSVGLCVTVALLVLGIIPFFIYKRNASNAWPSALEKSYIVTAMFFGVLFYAYWQSIRRSWFWKALIPIIPAHVVVVLVLIKIVLATWTGSDDQYPGYTYGALLSLIYGEWWVSNRIIEKFRRTADRRRQQ